MFYHFQTDKKKQRYKFCKHSTQSVSKIRSLVREARVMPVLRESLPISITHNINRKLTINKKIPVNLRNLKFAKFERQF